MSAADGSIGRVIGKGAAASVGVLAIALTLVSAAVGEVATIAKGHVRHPTCAQILPAKKYNQALYGAAPGGPGAARLSGVKVYETRRWIYPYNRSQTQVGSFCDYLWQIGQVPADYQAELGAPSGPTLGADMVVGFQVSTKTWRANRSAQQSHGGGTPADFPPGRVHTLHLGAGTQAFDEDIYSGTGPTTNSLAIFVLTAHHNYFAIYAWDASLAQLKHVAKTVLAYKAGGF